MRRILILTVITGALLTFLAGSVLQTLRLEGKGPLNVSSSDLLDSGTVARLGLQLEAVGGTVVRMWPNKVQVRDKHGLSFPITFASKALFYEGSTRVPESAIEVGTHISAEALHLSGGYLAFIKVRISPHRHAIGGVITATGGGLTIVNRHTIASFVRLVPDAAITILGRPFNRPLTPQLRVVAQAYPDPFVPGIFVSSKVQVLSSQGSRRVGGIVVKIDAGRNLLTIYSKSVHANYTIELLATTKTTLGPYTAGIPDVLLGDHLTVTGKPDLVNTSLGPNPILAKIVRIGSPAFGGVISGIAPVPHGGVVLTLRARHGHLLRVDAPSQALVYMVTGGSQQTAQVLDLFVGEHVSVRGQRTGKFELLAKAVHVYPHQRTVGGTVTSIVPGVIRILTTTGQQYLINTAGHTSYTLNGKLSTAAAVRKGLHIRVRGYDALHNDSRSTASLIAVHVSVTVHIHTVHHTTKKKKNSTAVPTHTAVPKATSTPKKTASLGPTMLQHSASMTSHASSVYAA